MLPAARRLEELGARQQEDRIDELPRLDLRPATASGWRVGRDVAVAASWWSSRAIDQETAAVDFVR